MIINEPPKNEHLKVFETEKSSEGNTSFLNKTLYKTPMEEKPVSKSMNKSKSLG